LREVLEELKKRGIPMGIVTGTPHPLADIALQTAGMETYFSFLLSPDEFPKGKNEEAIFREALRLLGAENPANVAFFEDQLYSIRTARAMGFFIVAPVDDYARKDKDEIEQLSDAYWETMGWQTPMDEFFSE
jgi:HAD superfamily hydrolase (TIGR01509 family)